MIHYTTLHYTTLHYTTVISSLRDSRRPVAYGDLSFQCFGGISIGAQQVLLCKDTTVFGGGTTISEADPGSIGSKTQWAEAMATEAMEMSDAIGFLNEEFPIRSLAEVLCEAVGNYKYGKRVEVPPAEARAVLLEAMGDGL